MQLMSILSSLLKVHQLSRVSFFSSKVHLWPCLSFPAAFLIAVSLSFALSMRVLVPLIFCIFLAPVVFDRCTVPYFKRFFLIQCSLLQHWPHEQLGILAFFHLSFLCLCFFKHFNPPLWCLLIFLLRSKLSSC